MKNTVEQYAGTTSGFSGTIAGLHEEEYGL